MKLSIDLAQV